MSISFILAGAILGLIGISMLLFALWHGRKVILAMSFLLIVVSIGVLWISAGM